MGPSPPGRGGVCRCLIILVNPSEGLGVGRHLIWLANDPPVVGGPWDRHGAGRLSSYIFLRYTA